ncbi:D-Ala-D-Ala carboxypeptidase family metallohydrolase [uncultured Parabacteroides sp.]|uniref:D-Ala-D-Ala carboxypeptidase family metallohydrolase n=1 Tax=uncultured Parabacteroides sp. TaxID=512312 RepID=UPI0025F44C02|nr:D-Ala-D-Ala carboxypeptidase family metallohydrolase [uncultured Parabacteroides sp.]
MGEKLTAKERDWRAKHKDWISEHFYMGEFEYSAVAVANGLDNTPTPIAQRAICHLVKNLLEPLRKKSGMPIYVSSGFRCPVLNVLVGGVPDSQHITGEAADIFTGGNARLLEILEEEKLNFDQAIFYRRKKFMHLSLKLKGKNRRQIIII